MRARWRMCVIDYEVFCVRRGVDGIHTRDLNAWFLRGRVSGRWGGGEWRDEVSKKYGGCRGV